jgi:hypothetical protein
MEDRLMADDESDSIAPHIVENDPLLSQFIAELVDREVRDGASPETASQRAMFRLKNDPKLSAMRERFEAQALLAIYQRELAKNPDLGKS